MGLSGFALEPEFAVVEIQWNLPKIRWDVGIVVHRPYSWAISTATRMAMIAKMISVVRMNHKAKNKMLCVLSKGDSARLIE